MFVFGWKIVVAIIIIQPSFLISRALNRFSYSIETDMHAICIIVLLCRSSYPAAFGPPVGEECENCGSKFKVLIASQGCECVL